MAIPRATLPAQDPGLPLSQAREIARRVSPELLAAREAVAAAAARERQAGAVSNPTLSYQREQTSGNGQTNSQNIASVDQPIELTGLRSARRAAARLRRDAAAARLATAEARLDFDVTRAYALALAADRRVILAEQASGAFARASTVSQTRLVEGDVSGYAHRRIRLEAARYAGLRAEALASRRAARLTLASLLAMAPDSAGGLELSLEDSRATAPLSLTTDSLRAVAVRHHPELRVVMLEAQAADADARLTRRERIPVPTLWAGLKNEEVAGGGDFNGFVAGVSLPLPLWDRRGGAIDAASAEGRRLAAEVEIVRRRIAREVDETVGDLRAVDEQLGVLRPQLGAESAKALLAAQVAYGEGEISLVEWLDAVRAYQEAESAFASLRAESLIRWAALQRAVGIPLSRESR
jgi:cobalt-zinc-cadmium efflux system outer membrane protein